MERCEQTNETASLLKLVVAKMRRLGTQRMASLFRFGGIFEEKDCFRTVRRLDTLLCEELVDEQPA